MKAYINARIFTGETFLTDHAVITDNDIIVDVVPRKLIPVNAAIVDLPGKILAPAFIDMQIYGGNGKLFSNELSAAAIQSTYDYCTAGGAAHFFITLATNSMEVFYKGIDAVRDYWRQGGKGMPGLHLEGPYLNPLKRGAHIEKYIKKPTVNEVKELLEYGKGVIKIMTIAPEQCDDAVMSLLQDRRHCCFQQAIAMPATSKP